MLAVRTSSGGLIDSYLGPRNDRFFGEGFKRVRHDITRVTITPGSPARIDAVVSIAFPVEWSTKGETAQKPHLSTIDVLVIGAQLTEALIARSHGLDTAQRHDMRLVQAKIRAGREPQEDRLDELPVWGRVIASTVDAETGVSMTTVECSIATLAITCVVSHPTGRPAETAAAFGSLHAVLGDPASRTYGTAYHTIRQVIDVLDIAEDKLSATASVTLEPGTQDSAGRIGMDAGTAPSMVDLFVTGLQLGQLLLYQLDDVPRAASRTLWMRRTVLELGTPVQPTPLSLTTRLHSPHLLPLNGAMWRSADIVTRLGQATMRCSVAHLLAPIEARA